MNELARNGGHREFWRFALARWVLLRRSPFMMKLLPLKPERARHSSDADVSVGVASRNFARLLYCIQRGRDGVLVSGNGVDTIRRTDAQGLQGPKGDFG